MIVTKEKTTAAKKHKPDKKKEGPAQKIVQSDIYNTILSAPTRSGKGVSSIIPTILSYPGSVIVLDFKSEKFN
jgi:type IV secretion system protein VirD4